MTDDSELVSEYKSVIITIRQGNEEVVYDLPNVENVITEVKYEDPVIRAEYPRIIKETKIELFTISMKPIRVDGKLYTIIKTTHAVDVNKEKEKS